jgi:hypothetical protein
VIDYDFIDIEKIKIEQTQLFRELKLQSRNYAKKNTNTE